jgi:hypothetical protein
VRTASLGEEPAICAQFGDPSPVREEVKITSGLGGDIAQAFERRGDPRALIGGFTSSPFVYDQLGDGGGVERASVS